MIHVTQILLEKRSLCPLVVLKKAAEETLSMLVLVLMTSALGEARETLEVVEERMRRSSVVVALFPR